MPAIVSASELSSRVDRYAIGINDTLTLTIHNKGDSQKSPPDTSELEKNFDILNSSSRSSLQLINFRKTASQEWIYLLAPKRNGKLLIPSFRVNDNFSDAITIDVSDTSNSQTTKPLFVETSVSKESLYLSEMFYYNIKVFSTEELGMPKEFPLDTNDFIVFPLPASSFHERLNNANYRVYEYRFAMLPTTTGDITIPGMRFQVSDGMPNNIFSLRSSRRHFLNVEPRTIEINPPADNLSNPWFVAGHVNLSSNLSNGKTIPVTAGEAITLAVHTTAGNALTTAIPDIVNPWVENINQSNQGKIKLYPEAPINDDLLQDNNLVANRTDRIAIIPLKPGQYPLPPLTLEWWDAINNVRQSETLPSITLNVSPSSTSPATPESNIASSKPLDPSVDSTTGHAVAPLATNDNLKRPWQWATGFFALLWLLTLTYTLTRKKPASAIISGPESRSPALDTKWKALSEALANNDAQQTRNTLLPWLTARFPEADTSSSESFSDWLKISQFEAADKFQDQINTLNASLYSGQQSTPWNGTELSEIIGSLGKWSPEPESNQALPPLYNQ
jgi:hypothetical protein